MNYQTILYEVNERIASVTLNRPDKRNALNAAIIAELKSALLQAQEDVSVKVIVLRGRGAAFSAGADLEYLQQMQQNSLEDNLRDSHQLMELLLQLYYHEKIVIAQVEGDAIAGGCGLAMVCDFCYSVPTARFGYTEVKIGFIPALVSVFLVRKIGEGRARELLLTGKLVSAEAAAQMGLINGVVGASQIGAQVHQLAEQLCKGASGHSLTLTKKLVRSVFDFSLQEALELAASLNAEMRHTEDCKKGVAAFLNKQSIIW